MRTVTFTDRMFVCTETDRLGEVNTFGGKLSCEPTLADWELRSIKEWASGERTLFPTLHTIFSASEKP